MPPGIRNNYRRIANSSSPSRLVENLVAEDAKRYKAPGAKMNDLGELGFDCVYPRASASASAYACARVSARARSRACLCL